MSKIGKNPIKIPDNVNVSLSSDDTITVSGPKGVLSLKLIKYVSVEFRDNYIIVHAKSKNSSQYQGLYRTLLNNLMVGVTQGFEKRLELVGVGYKASLQNGKLVLNVGYSHPVVIDPIDGIQFMVNDNIITVSGIDKVKVGDVAARIRSIRVPDRYKGKGIRYLGEVIYLKKGKSGK